MLVKNIIKRLLPGSVLAGLLAALLPGAPAAAAGPHVIDLGTLTGTCCSQAFDINDHGVVVGESQIGTQENPPERAFRWRNGHMQDLGTLGGPRAWAAAINNSGEIAGASALPDGSVHAFRWRPGYGMQDLGTLGGDSVAVGIDEAGNVVGYYADGTGGLGGFRWHNGVMTALTTGAGDPFVPAAVSANGIIAGTTAGVAATWKNGVIQTVSGGTATGVNRFGDVSGDAGQGVFLRKGGVLGDLALPAGSAYGSSTDLNDCADVVGWRTDGYLFRAVWWPKGGAPKLLPGLRGGQTMAWGNNNKGQIVGQSNLNATTGEYHAVLWTY